MYARGSLSAASTGPAPCTIIPNAMTFPAARSTGIMMISTKKEDFA